MIKIDTIEAAATYSEEFREAVRKEAAGKVEEIEFLHKRFADEVRKRRAAEKELAQLKRWIRQNDVEPVRHGRWVDATRDDPFYYCCSECGKLIDFEENYCPNCGARMDEEAGEDESTCD